MRALMHAQREDEQNKFEDCDDKTTGLQLVLLVAENSG
jgi:hypothetical protein